MKGEITKEEVLRFYSEEGLEKLKLISRRRRVACEEFLGMINGINVGCFYTLTIGNHLLPKNLRFWFGHCHDTWVAQELLTPFSFSRSGVIFHVLASTVSKEQYLEYHRTISERHDQHSYDYSDLIIGNLKEVPQSDLPLWVGSAYVTRYLEMRLKGWIPSSVVIPDSYKNLDPKKMMDVLAEQFPSTFLQIAETVSKL